jgi:hypothetical protein
VPWSVLGEGRGRARRGGWRPLRRRRWVEAAPSPSSIPGGPPCLPPRVGHGARGLPPSPRRRLLLRGGRRGASPTPDGGTRAVRMRGRPAWRGRAVAPVSARSSSSFSLFLGACEVGPAPAIADARYPSTFGGRERIPHHIASPAAASLVRHVLACRFTGRM